MHNPNVRWDKRGSRRKPAMPLFSCRSSAMGSTSYHFPSASYYSRVYPKSLVSYFSSYPAIAFKASGKQLSLSWGAACHRAEFDLLYRPPDRPSGRFFHSPLLCRRKSSPQPAVWMRLRVRKVFSVTVSPCGASLFAQTRRTVAILLLPSMTAAVPAVSPK